MRDRIPGCYGLLIVDIGDPELAREIVRSLSPDNRPLPSGMELEMRSVGGAVEMRVAIEDCMVMRLVSTMDEVLALIKMLLSMAKP